MGHRSDANPFRIAIPQLDRPLQVNIAARRIGSSPRTVRRHIKNGTLPARRVGRRAWELLPLAVEKFRERRRKRC